MPLVWERRLMEKPENQNYINALTNHCQLDSFEILIILKYKWYQILFDPLVAVQYQYLIHSKTEYCHFIAKLEWVALEYYEEFPNILYF